jgi:nicotinate-nucleotide pyrophosphorylase (carboxylating)
LQAGQEVARFSGPARAVLAIERVGLNFLGHLSGIATLTNQFVEAVAGSSAVICDTRKTIPGLRMLEKYAVAIGGGHNHRLGLYDAAMIKDNHLLCLGGGAEADAMEALGGRLAELRRQLPAEGFVQLEVDNLRQFKQVLGLKLDVDMVLLDNFSNEDLDQAVGMRNDAGLGEELLLEASGSVRLETVRKIAESGVDRISVGAVTHSAAALDFSMEFVLK